MNGIIKTKAKMRFMGSSMVERRVSITKSFDLAIQRQDPCERN